MAKDAVKSAQKEGLNTIFARRKGDDTHRERVTEQGVNDIRKRDEEAKIDRVHKMNATEKQRWENTRFQMRNGGSDARGIGRNSEHTDP